MIVKLNAPAALGVPDNTPVVLFSVKPGGNVPVELHVTVPTPPVCVKVCEYAEPAVAGHLLDDLARWFDPWNIEARDRLRQRWARDFYRAYDSHTAPSDDADAALSATEL